MLPSSRVICFGPKLADPYSGNIYDARWKLSPNVWHFVVGTWKKGDSIKLYIDGTLVNQTAAPTAYLYNVYWLNAVIGSRYRTESFFNGTIDEIMVYNKTLSAEEVQSLYLSAMY